MQRIIIVLLGIVLFLSVSIEANSFAINNTAQLVMYAEKEPSFRGKISDWQNSFPFFLYTERQICQWRAGLDDWDGPDDLSAVGGLKWNEKGLYFGIFITDDILNCKPEDGDATDRIVIYISSDNRSIDRFYTLTIFPAGNGKVPFNLGLSGKKLQGWEKNEIITYGKITSSGYCLEGLIPWKVLEIIGVSHDREALFQIMITDSDGKYQRNCELRWCYELAAHWLFPLPSSFGKLIFVRQKNIKSIKAAYSKLGSIHTEQVFYLQRGKSRIEVDILSPYNYLGTSIFIKVEDKDGKEVLSKELNLNKEWDKPFEKIEIPLKVNNLKTGTYLVKGNVENGGKRIASLADSKFYVKDKFPKNELTSQNLSVQFNLKEIYGLPIFKNCLVRGKDFWPVMGINYPQFFDKRLRLSKHSIMEEAIGDIWDTNTWDNIADGPNEALRLAPYLKRKGIPIILWPGCLSPSEQGSGAVYSRKFPEFLSEFKDQFYALADDECFWHIACKGKWRKYAPSGRCKIKEEAYEAWKKAFQEEFLKKVIGHQYYLTDSIAGIHHKAFEWGVDITGCQVGDEVGFASQQFAFARGASRQYQKPWGEYIATWFNPGRMTTTIYNLPSMDTYVKGPDRPGTVDWGPQCGPSPSSVKRLLYAGYYLGANLIGLQTASVPKGEWQGSILVANFDYKRDDLSPSEYVSRDNKRYLSVGKGRRHMKEFLNRSDNDTLSVRALRDRKYYLSPIGVDFFKWYDFIKKNPRGITYTPIVLMTNHLDLYSPIFLGHHLNWGIVPYWSKGDYMVTEFMNTLLPRNTAMTNERVLDNTPYGDIFDVLTDRIEVERLKGYPVVFLVGDLKVTGKLLDRLKEYVKDGGILIITAEQAKGIKDTRFLGLSIKNENLEGRKIIAEGKEIAGNLRYSYGKVSLKSAAPLMINKAGDPLVTINSYGKGKLIYTTTDWMLDKDEKVLPILDYLVKSFSKKLLPCSVEGNIQYIFNKVKDGWLIILINNNGVYQYPRDNKPPVINPECASDVTLQFRKRIEGATELMESEELFVKRDRVKVKVPAGEIRVVKVIAKD